MTADDIVTLIAACHKHQVTKFHAGDIGFTFSGYVEPVAPEVALHEQFRAEAEQAQDWLSQHIAPPPPVQEVL